MSSDLIFNRKNPFPARILENRKITGEGSNKETRHIEFSLEGSGLRYEAGDSLGVFPKNAPDLVDAVLDATGFSGAQEVEMPDLGIQPLREVLTSQWSLGEPSKQLLDAAAHRSVKGEGLRGLLDPGTKHELDAYIHGRDVLDILEEFRPKLELEELPNVFRKLQPRLYSIASSPKAVSEAVDLTVVVVRYNVPHSPRPRHGVCSSFLAERANGEARIFVHSAKHFRLPEDPKAPVIMVGAGTGIAPFRAFLQERRALRIKSPAWLIFGEQHAETDFFYQEEIEGYLADGTLTKLSTAFSRDQAHKIYVQNRLEEEGEMACRWLEAGGYFFICGDASRMAKDVDAALHRLVGTYGSLSPEESTSFIDKLKKEKRYRKDVY